MRPLASATAVTLLVVGLGGCASLDSAEHITGGSPRYFVGTRLDVAALSNDQEALAHFAKYGMVPPAHPTLDLPLSTAADSLLLLSSGFSGLESK